MKALGGNAGLPAVVEARLHCRLHGALQIRIVEHHEGIAAAQFHHALFQLIACISGQRAAGTFAAGERDCRNAVIAQHLGGLIVVDMQHVEHTRRNAGGV